MYAINFIYDLMNAGTLQPNFGKRYTNMGASLPCIKQRFNNLLILNVLHPQSTYTSFQQESWESLMIQFIQCLLMVRIETAQPGLLNIACF